MLKSDIPNTLEFVFMWLDAESEGAALQLGSRVSEAREATTTFCSAYVAVCSTGILTLNRHECYSKVFLFNSNKTTTKTSSDFYKFLGSSCRKNEGFKKLEKQLIDCAGNELEISDQYIELDEAFADDAPKLEPRDIFEKALVMAKWPRIRPSVLESLHQDVMDAVIKSAAALVESAPDEDGASQESLSDNLQLLSKAKEALTLHAVVDNPDTSAKAAKVTAAIVTQLQGLIGKGSTKTFKLWADSIAKGEVVDELMDESFVSKLDSIGDKDAQPEKNMLSIQVVLGQLKELLDSQVKACDSIEGFAKLDTISRNLCAVVTFLGTPMEAGDIVDVDVTIVATLITTFKDMMTAHTNYQNAATKTNALALCKAGVNFRGFSLPRDRQSIWHVGFLRCCLESLYAAMSQVVRIQQSKAELAQLELRTLATELGKFSKVGLRLPRPTLE
jgi:hypothetical protein